MASTLKVVEIDFYEKVYAHCPACVSQKKIVEAWIEKNESDLDITYRKFPLEEHVEELQEKHRGLLGAPVIEILRNGERHVVSGNNPDILADYLNGIDSVWDEL